MQDDRESIETSAEQLTKLERSHKLPHVVILGAGASVAALPSGDRAGRELPLMHNFAEVVGLEEILADAGMDHDGNFETIYGELHRRDATAPILSEIEDRVETYFERLALPEHVTLYDLLLTSLRPKDAIFTFNWDPLLADAYMRHADYAELPPVFHLHGNVRTSTCQTCGLVLNRTKQCPVCGGDLRRAPLLYPIEQKNYTDNPFIAGQWEAAEKLIPHAFLLTIFGYSAPSTDQNAYDIIMKAWQSLEADQRAHRIEIIDIQDRDTLAEKWGEFSSHYHYYDVRKSFYESLLARYPRRSCEAWYSISLQGKYTHPIPWGANLCGLKQSVEELQQYEADR